MFHELKRRTSKRIQKNRNQAYLGSLQHFFKSVYQNNYEQQGFKVRKLENRRNPFYPSDSAIAVAEELLRNNPSMNINNPALKVLKISSATPKYLNYLFPELLNRDDFTTEINNRLFFNIEYYLNVEYIMEKEPIEYIATLHYSEQEVDKNQTSLIWNTDNIEIFSNGIHSPTEALWLAEYLGFEKLADMVPSDFIISE